MNLKIERLSIYSIVICLKHVYIDPQAAIKWQDKATTITFPSFESNETDEKVILMKIYSGINAVKITMPLVAFWLHLLGLKAQKTENLKWFSLGRISSGSTWRLFLVAFWLH